MFNLGNFVGYQLAWFAVILGAAHGFAWAGALVALGVAAMHQAVKRDSLDLKLMAVAAGVGMLIDSTLAMTGQARFESSWPDNLAPYWMLSLWIVFATTLNHSLRWLMTQPLYAAIAGAIGGPLAYLAGQKLGALSIFMPTVTYLIISMLWSVAMLALSMMVLRASVAPAASRMPA
jgi:hypothetical protein